MTIRDKNMVNLRELYEYFKKNSLSTSLSSHWAHVEDIQLEMFFEDPSLFDSFLRRNISVGINDISLVFARDKWEKKNRSPEVVIPLSPEAIENDFKSFRNAFKALSLFEGCEYYRLLGSDIGGPYSTVQLSTSNNNIVKTNYHEASLLYFALRFRSYLLENKSIRLVEIGGGFGGVIGNLLRLCSKKISAIWLIDLPVNLLLSYVYLKALIKKYDLSFNLIAFDMEELKLVDRSIFFVPIDKVAQIPNFNAAVNTRSFMEMSSVALEGYFSLIQDKMEIDGLFFNINRLNKKSDSGEIRLKDYPYDSRWEIIESTRSFQFNVWELFARRTKTPNNSMRYKLENLPPFVYNT